MSLIQEALRRQQQENEDTSVGQTPPPGQPNGKPEPFPFPVSIDEGNLTNPPGGASNTPPKAGAMSLKKKPVRITTATSAPIPKTPAPAAPATPPPAAPPPRPVAPSREKPPTATKTTAPQKEEPQTEPAKSKKSGTKKSEAKQSNQSPKVGLMVLAIILIALLGGGAIYYQFYGFPWSNTVSGEVAARIPTPEERNTAAEQDKLAGAKDTSSSQSETAGNKNDTQATTSPTDKAKESIRELEQVAGANEITKAVEQDLANTDKVIDNAASSDFSHPKVSNEVAHPATASGAKPAVIPVGVNQVATPKQPRPQKSARVTAKQPRPAPKPPTEWPHIKLKGIVGNGANGSVMLNNSIVGVNDSIEGVTVTKIAPNGVWLEYNGEKRYLKVGKTIQ